MSRRWRRSGRARRPTASRTRSTSTRPRSTGCAMTGSSTRAPARGRRSRRTRRSAAGRGAGSGVPAAAGSGSSPRTRARACGWRSGRARSAGSTCWRGRWPTSPRRPATSSRATGWATGRTAFAWSSTTSGTASTWSSAAATCSMPRPSSCGWPACSAAETPPSFLHHPLVRRVSGQKLSKSEGDTAVRALLDAGSTPADLFGLAARLAGLRDDAVADRTGRPRLPVRGWSPLASGCVQAQPISGSFARAQASTPPSGRTIHATFGFGLENSRQRTECRPVSTADDGNAPGSAYGRTVCVREDPSRVPEVEGATAVQPHGRLPATVAGPRVGMDLVGCLVRWRRTTARRRSCGRRRNRTPMHGRPATR